MATIKLSESKIRTIKDICKSFDNNSGEVINVLHQVQGAFGYLPAEVQEVVAMELNMPSIEGSVKAVINSVKKNFKNPHLYLIHSNSKNEKVWFEEFKKQLSEQKEVEYTLFSWAASNRLVQMLKNDNSNVVVSIYDEAPGKNKAFSNLLMNKLFSLKKTTLTLLSSAIADGSI